MEEGTELLHRLQEHLEEHPQKDEPLPMFTSCCPGWVAMVEKSNPELIPYLSTCKSPQMMMGAVVKNYFAREAGVAAHDIVCTSVMPCVRKQVWTEQRQTAASSGAEQIGSKYITGQNMTAAST